MNPFKHKKIGIWGFGIVGQSALTYFDQQNPTSIEILDTKFINLPITKTQTSAIMQTYDSIQKFLESNDFIVPSPGIKLHNYQQFTHKFINELDLLHDTTNFATLAITGTIGKTSITHLLESIIKTIHPNTLAAGNIGHGMLNLISTPTSNTNKQQTIILELSSFQLQPIKKFAPDLAIITNFYPNHLDHHQSIEEYFDAKCNIFKYQTEQQQALLPLDIIDIIIQKNILKKNWALFSSTKPTEKQIAQYHHTPIYFLENRIIYTINNHQIEELFNCNKLPALTFDNNWLIIIAACHLYKISLTSIQPVVRTLQLPDHRLQKIAAYNGSHFYNDSKATVWQATLQAVQSMGNKPTKLFVGGLSKGADRTPLIQALVNKNLEIYAFGKEAEQIAQLCKQFKILHHTHATLDEAFAVCMDNLTSPHEILFSPGGSSFDLFADYKTRGDYFVQLVQQYCKKS